MAEEENKKPIEIPPSLADSECYEQLQTFIERRNSRGLEAILNLFFSSITASEAAFLLFPDLGNKNVKIFMINENELNEPKVIDINCLKIKPCLFYFKPMIIDDFEESFVNEIQQFLQMRLVSLLLLPLRLKLVPGHAAAMVCCVNKHISKLVEMNTKNLNVSYTNFVKEDYSKTDVCFLKEFMSDAYATYDREINDPCPGTIAFCLGKILCHRIKNRYMVLKCVSHQIKTLVNAEACSIYMLKFHTQTVIPIYYDKTNCANIRQAAYKSELGFYCNCTICLAMRRNTTINVTTIISLTDVDKQLDSVASFNTKTMIACPLVVADRTVYGCIEVNNKIEEHRFNELDASVVTNLSKEIALFVKKYYKDFLDGRYT